MNNQITHKEYESKVKRYQDKMSNAKCRELELKKSIASYRKKWEEGHHFRIRMGLTDDQDTEWEIPSGKMRMEDFMEQIRCEERELRWVRTDMASMRLCHQNFLDSLSTQAVPVAEAHGSIDECGYDNPSSKTCCPGGTENTVDSSSDDEDNDM